MKYNKVVTRETKYKKGNFVKMVDDKWLLDNIAHIIDINEFVEVPDYHIEAFDKKTGEKIKAWVDEEEILKKTNSKGKERF